MKRTWQILGMAVTVGAVASGCTSDPPAKDPSQATATGSSDAVPVAAKDPSSAGTGAESPMTGGAPRVTGEEGGEWGILDRDSDAAYGRVVDKVSNMVTDSELSNRVRTRGLGLVNVMWEDTG